MHLIYKKKKGYRPSAILYESQIDQFQNHKEK